jgi:hypothetical protein
VTYLKQIVRRVAFVFVILGVAAAATATWQQYAPKGVCLYCVTPEHYDAALNATPRAVAPTTAEVHRGSALGVNSKPVVVPDMTSEPASHHDNGGGMAADAPREWRSWEHESESHAASPSAAAGPLWLGMVGLQRMIAFEHFAEPGGGIGTAAPRSQPQSQSAEQHAAAESRPSPAAPPAANSKPNPGSTAPRPPATPPAAPPAGVIAGPAAPTDPFALPAAPPANPFALVGPIALLDPAGPGGTLTPSVGRLAATPEPASMFLLGTGVALFLNELRRRRVV